MSASDAFYNALTIAVLILVGLPLVWAVFDIMWGVWKEIFFRLFRKTP